MVSGENAFALDHKLCSALWDSCSVEFIGEPAVEVAFM